MKFTKLRFSTLSLLAAASMVLASCGGPTASTPVPAGTTAPTAMTAGSPTAGPSDVTPTAPTTSGGVVKIGVDLPVSGGDASDGIPTRNGMELAIKQINDKGGVTLDGKTYKVEMFFLDDVPPGGQAHDPAQSAKNSDSFIADPDVIGVLGPFNSANAKAMMPKLNNAGLCQISPANTNETLTKPEFGATKDLRPTGNVTYFRVVTTDDVQGPAAADFALTKLNKTKVYILDDTEAYGKGIADNFEKRWKEKGGTVLGHDGVPKGTTDYSSIMTKIASTGADIVFYGGTSSNNIPLARKQMKSAGLDIPLMGGDGIKDDEYLKVSGADGDGSYATVAAVNVETLDEAKQFIADYKAAYPDATLGAYSGPGYETASILLDAIKRGGKKDKAAVCAALRETKNYKGVLGTTSFDANGDTDNKVISFYEMKGGKWVFVDQLRFGDTTTTSPTPEAGMTSGPAGGTVKIGVDLPVSGGDASDGIPTRNGMELAIKQINDKGGVQLDGKTYKVEMFFLDDVPPGGQAHDPAQSAKNSDSFIADPDVIGVLGPFNSANAKAMMPKLNNAGLCQISPANTNETLTKPEFGATKDLRPTGNVTYFRVVTTDDVQGPAAADFALTKLNKTKVYILDDTEAYGKGIADNFEKRWKEKGGTVLGHDGVPKGTTDYSSIMTKIAATGADIIFYGGTSSNNIPLARKQMKSAGLDIPLMGGDGIKDDEYLKVSGADGDGSYATVAAVNVETLDEAKQFIADYKAAYPDATLGAYSGPGYETAAIMLDAIKRGGKKDKAAVCAALRQTTGYKGVLGTTSFDANGDTDNKVISFYEMKGGKWVFVDQLRFGAP